MMVQSITAVKLQQCIYEALTLPLSLTQYSQYTLRHSRGVWGVDVVGGWGI